MTVRELMAVLSGLDPDMPVVVCGQAMHEGFMVDATKVATKRMFRNHPPYWNYEEEGENNIVVAEIDGEWPKIDWDAQ